MAKEKISLDSLAIEITPHCNQHCIYCYNAWRTQPRSTQQEPDLATLKKWIGRLVDQAEFPYLSLTGGEPFLRQDLPELIGFINNLGPEVMLISNGGKITPESALSLKGLKVAYVQFTLGGADPATHDALCGSGSFAGVQRAAGYLEQAGITPAGSYLCTSRNFGQAGEIMELFAAYGTAQVAFNRFNPSGEARKILLSLLPTRSQVLTALESVNQKAVAHKIRVVSTMPLPLCMIDPAAYPGIEFGQCSAGTRQAQYALGTDGRLRLCTLQKTAIGSIEDTPLAELISHPRVAAFRAAIPAFCSACPLASRCLGGCGAAAEWIFGSAAELDPFVAQHVMEDFQTRVKTPPTGGSQA